MQTSAGGQSNTCSFPHKQAADCYCRSSLVVCVTPGLYVICNEQASKTKTSAVANHPLHSPLAPYTHTRAHTHLLPLLSSMCTMSCPPRCFSLCTMVPTRPLLWPPVTMARLPRSNCGRVTGRQQQRRQRQMKRQSAAVVCALESAVHSAPSRPNNTPEPQTAHLTPL